MARAFLDTNVLVYAVDATDAAKQKTAARLLDTHKRAGTGALSTQVLQEFFVSASRRGVPPTVSRGMIVELSQMTVVQVTPQLILEAIDLHRLSQISFWDALLLRAARAANCAELLTEDLNSGQVYDGVRAVNPFKRG